MITNNGKNILAKYLIGQAPAYASYLAFGCGQKPLQTTSSFEDYSGKQSLDLEMFRSPITSRGYVKDFDELGNEYSEIVFTAALPTDQRYEITEVGVFSAGANPEAASVESGMLLEFTNNESWEYHSSSSTSAVQAYGSDLGDPSQGIIEITDKAFNGNSDSLVLDNNTRLDRNERPRYLNQSLYMSGTSSAIVGTGTSIEPDSSDLSHIHLLGKSINLDKYSSQDELRLGVSVLNRNPDTSNPTDVKIIVEFTTAEGVENPQSAFIKAHLTAVDDDLNNNRYFVISKKLEELETTEEFSWQSVSIVKVYVSVLSDGTNYSDDFFVALDALRIENVSSVSPLYGLTGYTVTKTDSGYPIIKDANTSNLVEFRFAMDVQ